MIPEPELEARSRDATGNVEDPPASHSWFVDSKAPDVRITAGPSGGTRSTSATFEFESSESTATFECALDSSYSAWAPCESPKTTRTWRRAATRLKPPRSTTERRR